MPSATTFFSYLVLGLATLASFVGANPAPSLTTKDIDSGLSARSGGFAYHRRAFQSEPRTNAERLRRGLSPFPPTRRRTGSRLQARQSATPPPPCTADGTITTGYISVTYGGTVPNGYLGKIGASGEFSLTPSTDTALHVSFASSCSATEITILNPTTSHTFIGGSQGFNNNNDNLEPGTSLYLHLVEVSHSPLGRDVSVGTSFSFDSGGENRPSESTIWNIGADGDITPTWINPDGSPVLSTAVVYLPSAGAFYLVGDVSEFVSQYGASAAKLTFVADP